MQFCALRRSISLSTHNSVALICSIRNHAAASLRKDCSVDRVFCQKAPHMNSLFLACEKKVVSYELNQLERH